jgi:gamma-glutamyltranspeptidase/glutathione hydrolase
MRTEPAPQRRAVLAGAGMVAASHPSISLAGARLLADGGNAIDATLAMAAMSWLALPGQCGIAGDAFAIVREPDGRVWTMCGSGFGPDGGTPDFYREQGFASLPLDGAFAVAVPGEVAALRAIEALGATRPLTELWEPVAALADRGMPCTVKTREDVAAHASAIARDPGASSIFLPDGELPAVGRRLAQPELAATIRRVAADPGWFYDGEFAERAVSLLAGLGVPFSGEEWQASGVTTAAAAICAPYGGMTLHETPMPTPGWMVLQQAALCDGDLRETDLLGAPAVHRMAAAARIAFQDRWEHCGSDSDSWADLLTQDAIRVRREQIRLGSFAAVPAGRPDGDTTSTLAVDADGRAVSFIHSLAFTFGARLTVPGTGAVLNNRLGRGAYLIDGHPNQVRPRRRPLHTLNAWLLTDAEGQLRHVGNTPGGDGQVQWNLQLVSHLVDHGLDPQQAVSAPRFTVFPGSDADVVGLPPELRCESRLPEAVRSGLRELGHDVVVEGPWDAGGSALVISVEQAGGVLSGGADPRQEGVVLGV